VDSPPAPSAAGTLAVKPTFLPDTNGGSGGVLYISPAMGYANDLQPRPTAARLAPW
jgi:hypothetical protein